MSLEGMVDDDVVLNCVERSVWGTSKYYPKSVPINRPTKWTNLPRLLHQPLQILLFQNTRLYCHSTLKHQFSLLDPPAIVALVSTILSSGLSEKLRTRSLAHKPIVD